MANPTVGADLLEPLDALRALAAKVAFDGEAVVDIRAKLGDLLVGQVTHLGVGREAELGSDLPRVDGPIP